MSPRTERGVSVENQARSWGGLRVGRILSGGGERPIRIIERSDENNLSCPPLAYGDNWVASLRFQRETGEILVPIWRELEKEKVLASPESYSQLRRRNERRVNLNSLTTDRPLVRLTHARVDNLEAAIRQQRHIIDEYTTGGEGQQIEDIMAQIGFQQAATLRGPINRESLERLARTTEEFLNKSKLKEARISSKIKIREALRRACQPDSLGRINPLVMRVRLRSAYLLAVKREIMPALIGRKFNSFLGILLMERILTREVIERTVEDLDTLAGITKRGAVFFEKGQIQESVQEGLKAVLGEIANSLGLGVRLLPYLPFARVAGINLKGCREKHQELNRGIIGSEMAERLYREPSVIDLISRGDAAIAKQRIKFLITPLRTVLSENQEIGMEIR